MADHYQQVTVSPAGHALRHQVRRLLKHGESSKPKNEGKLSFIRFNLTRPLALCPFAAYTWEAKPAHASSSPGSVSISCTAPVHNKSLLDTLRDYYDDGGGGSGGEDTGM